ncbi:MAG: hypothetical protein ACRDC4_13825 [Plesiomonas sp.]
MSVWSYGKGVLLFPKKAPMGVKESIDNSLGVVENNRSVELDDKYESQNYRRFFVKFSLCLDGVDAAQCIEKILRDLKNLGATDLYFDTDIRFLM